MYTDLLVRIKNAQAARKRLIRVPFSKMDFAILQKLLGESYVRDVRKKTVEKRNFLEIELFSKGHPSAVDGFKMMSTPGRRLYVGYRALRAIKQGYGIGMLSTPQGIMTTREARKKKVGGEYLFEVW